MSLVKENKNNSLGVKTEREIYRRMSSICRIFGHVYGCVCVKCPPGVPEPLGEGWANSAGLSGICPQAEARSGEGRLQDEEP